MRASQPPETGGLAEAGMTYGGYTDTAIRCQSVIDAQSDARGWCCRRLRARGSVDEQSATSPGDPQAEPAAIFEPALVSDVGAMVPSLLVTVATRPEWFAKDCTNPPLMLPSTLSANRCVHCPPT